MNSIATLPPEPTAAAAPDAPVESIAPEVLSPDAIARRRVLKSVLYGAAGMAFYAGEIERHWIDIVHRDIRITGLPRAFDGLTVAQLCDVHLDEYTEPFLLREAIDH